MKRLTREARLRQIRLTRRREARAAARGHVVVRVGVYFPSVRRGILRAPKKVNLMNGGQREVVGFLRAIARRVLSENESITIDFRQTESLAADGTLLLLAEIDRVISLSSLPKPITCRAPWHKRPREVLKQIGMFELTGDAVDVTPERADVVFWKATKGKDQSGGVFGPVLEYVAQAVDKKSTASIEAGELWAGVSEAIINAVDHAYEGERGDGYPHAAETRWWMFTQLRDEVFTVAVCDLGIGYRRSTPHTIPKLFIDAIAAKLSGHNLDARAIQAAMRYGVSGTKEKHRGKGSRDALSLLMKHGRGELLILSDTGAVRYELLKGAAEPLMTTFDLGLQTRSTIVWWCLPLGG